MGSVIVFNSERMLAIENSTVVAGEVNEDGHLILITRDGTEIDAGWVQPENLADASETVKGIVELADETEAEAGTDDTRALTPKSGKALVDQQIAAIPAVPDASVTVKGIAELATDVETVALTDPSRVVTPLGLGAAFRYQTETHYGTVTGVSSTGITVDLDDSLGTITATKRNSRYFPVIGDSVMLERSGTSWMISAKPKAAKAVRADITLTTNWTRYNTESTLFSGDQGAGWGPAHVFKTSNNIVHLHGLIRKWQGGAFVSGEKIGTLPAGFRPDYNCMFTQRNDTGAGRIMIDASDGSIYALDGGAGFISLDNICYPLGLTWTNLTLLNSWAATTTWAVPSGPSLVAPTPGYALDSNGICWTRGGALRASDPSADTAIFTYGSGFGPISSYRNHMRSGGHTATTFGYTTVGVAGSVNRDRRWQSPCSRGVSFDGTPFVSESSTLVPFAATTAIPAPLVPDGATSYSSGANWTPRAYVTPEGFVILHGLGAMAALGTMGWMAPELRPRYRRIWEAVTTAAAGRLDLYANGRMQSLAGTLGWWAQDCIHWIADSGEIDIAHGGS